MRSRFFETLSSFVDKKREMIIIRGDKVIDIRNYPEVINIINAALNDKRVIEVKNETRRDNDVNIVVVALGREVLTKPKKKNSER